MHTHSNRCDQSCALGTVHCAGAGVTVFRPCTTCHTLLLSDSGHMSPESPPSKWLREWRLSHRRRSPHAGPVLTIRKCKFFRNMARGSECWGRTLPPVRLMRKTISRFIPHVGLSLHLFQNIRSFHILSEVKIPAPMVFFMQHPVCISIA